MSEIEYPIFVYCCLGHIKVCTDQMNYDRVKEPIEKFVQEFLAFVKIGEGKFGRRKRVWRGKPIYIRDLFISREIQRVNLESV